MPPHHDHTGFRVMELGCNYINRGVRRVMVRVGVIGGWVSRLSYLDREYETLPTANHYTDAN